MNKPVVAIIGRPNVGKSTLFNRITGNRKAIVEKEPNITRDRIYAEVEWLNKKFFIIDTGGIITGEKDLIKSKIKEQAEIAINEADVLLFVVDGRTGLTILDEEIAEILRKSKKDIIIAVNKIEDFSKSEELKWDFYPLGFEEIIPISAEHGKNTGNLLDQIISKIPEINEIKDDDVIDVAIVGKPNVGKSSLVNYIVGHERVIVSDIPGTTRDAIDTTVIFNEQKYNLIDTAGLRRKSKVKGNVEYYSNLRSLNAIERADAVLMLLDANEGVSEQDKKILGHAHNNGKAIVLAVNKWDIIEKNNKTMESYRENIYYNIKFLTYAPITFISALKGSGINEALKLIEYSVEQNTTRIKTGLLNEVLQEAVTLREPPSKKGKRLKLYFAQQVGVKPPFFIFYVNNPELMHFSYERYLENTLRDTFGFIGTPIKIKLKKRK